MICVQYFVCYCEVLGIDGEQLNWDVGLVIFGVLCQFLVECGGVWECIFGEQNLMCVCNQELCGFDELLQDGDEVVFFFIVIGG